jgi:hypothetical protein
MMPYCGGNVKKKVQRDGRDTRGGTRRGLVSADQALPQAGALARPLRLPQAALAPVSWTDLFSCR